jgi:hypothetical protein
MSGIYLALSSLRLIMVIQTALVMMWWSVALNFDDSIEAQVSAAVRVVWVAMLRKIFCFLLFLFSSVVPGLMVLCI